MEGFSMAREWKFAEEDFIPVCPYCEKEIERVVALETEKKGGKKRWWNPKTYKEIVIACPECKKIVGACTNTNWG